MKNLSKHQLEVIILLREGWQLGYDSFANHYWLQKNGLGYGGETKKVNVNTFKSLCRLNIIKSKAHEFPVTQFYLNFFTNEPITEGAAINPQPQNTNS